MIYSQNAEQAVIHGWLASRSLLIPSSATPPRAIDIGAADGVQFSNTLALYELGWGGVAVEASPRQVARLLDLYQERGYLQRHPGRVEVIASAMVADDYVCCCWLNEAESGLTSTTVPGEMHRWPDERYRPVRVGVCRAEDLDWARALVLSIDVEGNNTALLEPCLQLGDALRIVCIEKDNTPGIDEPGARLEQVALLRRHGFELVHENHENLIAARE